MQFNLYLPQIIIKWCGP